MIVRARRVYVIAVAAHSRPRIRNNGDHKAKSHRAVWVSAPDAPKAICCTSPRIDNIARSTMNVASGHSVHRTSHTGSHRRGRTVARANKTPTTARTTLTASATHKPRRGGAQSHLVDHLRCKRGDGPKGSAAEHPVGLEQSIRGGDPRRAVRRPSARSQRRPDRGEDATPCMSTRRTVRGYTIRLSVNAGCRACETSPSMVVVP
jgi:hypothetical protein